MANFNISVIKEIFYSIVNDSSVKIIVAYFMCCYAYLFGNGDVLIPVFVLVILDLITGLLKATKLKDLNSPGARRGAMKFAVYLILIAMANVIDREFPGQYASTIMKSFLMVTEAISIMENIGAMGWPVPTKLLKYLKNYQGQEKKD